MRDRYTVKLWVLLLFSVFCSVSSAEEIINASLDRAWGLLLGDEVKVQLELANGEDEIDISSLPQVDKRYGTWLYLKGLDLELHQLTFTYQIVNVPTENTLISTPEFNIRELTDNWIVIPAMPLTIGPLLPMNRDASSTAKPDHAPMLISTIENERKIKLFAGLAILSSLILLIWHFGWKPKNRQPFAQAVHDLSRLKWHRATSGNHASRILHAAFNQTADTIVVHSKLDQVYEQVPWLTPLKDDIDIFYQQSANYFFTRNAEQEPDFELVKKLAKACRAKEKMA